PPPPTLCARAVARAQACPDGPHGPALPSTAPDRTMTAMDLDRARAFVARNHNAVMLTRHADGRPQMSPVTVGVDAEGRLVVSSRETAIKTRNVRRDPEVALCVFTDKF